MDTVWESNEVLREFMDLPPSLQRAFLEALRETDFYHEDEQFAEQFQDIRLDLQQEFADIDQEYNLKLADPPPPREPRDNVPKIPKMRPPKTDSSKMPPELQKPMDNFAELMRGFGLPGAPRDAKAPPPQAVIPAEPLPMPAFKQNYPPPPSKQQSNPQQQQPPKQMQSQAIPEPQQQPRQANNASQPPPPAQRQSNPMPSQQKQQAPKPKPQPQPQQQKVEDDDDDDDEEGEFVDMVRVRTPPLKAKQTKPNGEKPAPPKKTTSNSKAPPPKAKTSKAPPPKKSQPPKKKEASDEEPEEPAAAATNSDVPAWMLED